MKNFEDVFSEIKEKFSNADVSEMQDHIAIQIELQGQGAGVFYVEVKDGTLYVEPYDYYDRDAKITAPSKVILDIIEGKKDDMTAFTLGQLSVEGNLDKVRDLWKAVKHK